MREERRRLTRRRGVDAPTDPPSPNTNICQVSRSKKRGGGNTAMWLLRPNRKTNLNSLIWPPALQAKERRIQEEEGVLKARSRVGFPGSLSSNTILDKK